MRRKEIFAMQDVKILVAIHKPYKLPTEEIYVPILVGGVQIPGLTSALRDNSGQNISDKNACYCEITALYGAWKNLDARYLGLVHYRCIIGGILRGNILISIKQGVLLHAQRSRRH